MVAQGVDLNGPKEPGQGESPVGILELWTGTGFSAHHDAPLMAAARAGKLETVKWLVEHGASPDAQKSAIVLRDLRQVSGMAVFKPVRVMGDGNNALSSAVLAGQTAVVQFLLEHGADVSRRVVFQSATIPGIEAWEGFGQPFVFARRGDSLKIDTDGSISTNTDIRPAQELSIRELMANSLVPEIKTLSTVKGNPAASGSAGPTGLASTNKEADLAHMKDLLKAHPELISKKIGGFTLLHNFVQSGSRDGVELLVANKADVNAAGPGGTTALQIAAALGFADIAEFLLANHAEVNAATTAGATALVIAAETSHTEVAKMLLAHGATADAANQGGQTALHLAAMKGNKVLVELLVGRGASTNTKDINGITACMWARHEGKNEVADFLRSHGCQE